MKKILFSVMIVTLLLMGYLSKLSYENTQKFYLQSAQLSIDKTDQVKTLVQKVDAIIEDITFHYFGGKEQKKINNLKKKSDYYLQANMEYLIVFLMLLFSVSIILLRREKEFFYLFLSIVTLVSLLLSLFIPIVLLSLPPENTYDVGKLDIYMDEIKTMVSILEDFFIKEEYLLFFMTSFFMIFLPFVRSVFTILFIFLKKQYLMNSIKKWIVVEIIFMVTLFFISLFILKGKIKEEVFLESGFYFFVLYIFLSILFVLQKRPKQNFNRKKARANVFIKDDYY